VICVNQTGTFAQMDATGARWPEAHAKAEPMARLAMGAYTILGFDAVRVPSCQTFEAEALGCQVKWGGEEHIPGFATHPYNVGDEIKFPPDFLDRGRIPELLEAVRILKKALRDEVAIIGGIIGPYTIVASIIHPKMALRATIRQPDALTPFLEVAERAGTTLAHALVEAGADIIAIEDMLASSDVISAASFARLAAPYEKRQHASIPVPTILHICGKIDPIAEAMAETRPTALSVEPKANLALSAEVCRRSNLVLIGGVDTLSTLFSGTQEAVAAEALAALEGGVDMIAPGCSIAPATPTENLWAMVEQAKKFGLPKRFRTG